MYFLEDMAVLVPGKGILPILLRATGVVVIRVPRMTPGGAAIQ